VFEAISLLAGYLVKRLHGVKVDELRSKVKGKVVPVLN
jgi:hypothetical protein